MPEKTKRVRMIYFEDIRMGVQPVSPEFIVDGKDTRPGFTIDFCKAC